MNGNAEEMAFLTHFLHNFENSASSPYRQKAIKYYEELNLVEDQGFQQMLPIKWDVPFPAQRPGIYLYRPFCGHWRF